ncbi:oxygen-independent coproporphyrinogen III oxidase [Bacillus sp. V3B]|uniref:radical SAM family heme chaperone HemW n=1 Tax=Bacillus sp. V3B TaxID=2804915 RepID=UPI00210EBA36|nr:radical SAM family heme chaperone HemW [Bacillus sp. V3B]MCQ6273622.1 oxygen-independent coproporphyrinogen III oxidase [Bacillus sp. V3B]
MVQAAYIHIPFCEHICHYCDFNKIFLKGQPVDEYLTALEEEIKLTLAETPTKELHSIFVGGGTPTALNVTQLEKLCQIIRGHLPFNERVEFTFEANPGDLSTDKLRVLYDSGVNRLSFGVQSFNDELLKKIGRTHKAEDVFRSVDAAKRIGFHNISLDLIYSLPGQTLEDFKQTLETSFSLETTHFSGYSLIIEPKTIFYQLLNKGRLQLPDEDDEAAMYEMLMDQMNKHGYQQYEISNFSKKGYESRHNLTYWNNDYYYGFGAGAHSYLNGVRRSNYGPLKKYMTPIKNRQLPIMDENFLTSKEMWEEEMFLGLRKIKGVSINHFLQKFGESPLVIFESQIEQLKEKKLIDVSDKYISLTQHGRFLGNEAFQAFLL